MIDNFSIFYSTAVLVYILWRAVRFDRLMPWYSTATDPTELPSLKRKRRWEPREGDEPRPVWRR